MKSVLAKISRADKLHKELISEAESFWKSLKTDCVIEDGRPVYRVREIGIVPDSLNCVFGDLIHNLNSALDCIAYYEFSTNKLTALKKEDVYFPILGSASSLDSNLESYKNISHKFYSVIKDIQPHKENNLLLWQLRKLDNFSKHRSILISLPEVVGVDIASDLNLPPDFKFFLKPADGNISVGEKIFTSAPGTKCDPVKNFSFDLILKEQEVGLNLELGKFATLSVGEVKKIYKLFSS